MGAEALQGSDLEGVGGRALGFVVDGGGGISVAALVDPLLELGVEGIGSAQQVDEAGLEVLAERGVALAVKEAVAASLERMAGAR